MKTTIVLAMHGAPPLDFPKAEMAEVMGGHGHDHSSQNGNGAENGHSGHDGHDGHDEHAHKGQAAEIGHETGSAQASQMARQRRAALAAKMRAWPRTPENDPFYAGSYELAEHLARAVRCDVEVGFNEFCDPTVPQALKKAVEDGAQKVVIITPMMTKGGEHSELDIFSAVQSAKKRYPQVDFVYAWPFEVEEVAAFLAAHIQRFAGVK